MRRPTRLVRRLMRTHLLMALITLSALWSVMAFLAWFPLLRVATADFSTVIVEDLKALSVLRPEQRAGFAELMAREHMLHLLDAPPAEPAQKPLFFPYLSVLEKKLESKLGQVVNIYAVNLPAVDYFFAVHTSTGVICLGFPHERIGTAPALTLSAMFFFVTLAAILGAWLLTRWLVRPLDALRLGARRLATDRAFLIPVDSGVKELNELAQAYNALAGDLRRMVEQRSALLAGIAHDLRTPMARMELALELTKVTEDPARLERIADDLAQMRELIDSYVDFTAGCARRPPEQVTLGAQISRLVEACRADVTLDLAEAANIRLVINRQAFDRIIGNLLDNAVKHGQPPLALRAKLDDETLRIEIENAGATLSEDECAMAFEPFARLDPARNPQRPGSGLGLSIVRDIATANGWRVGLTPCTGGGVRAWLELPYQAFGAADSAH
ncbi:MAG: HAMP domain-containing sensor histidine kinase [Pseudomonadota bacterium]